jgi:hypothetical protein
MLYSLQSQDQGHERSKAPRVLLIKASDASLQTIPGGPNSLLPRGDAVGVKGDRQFTLTPVNALYASEETRNPGQKNTTHKQAVIKMFCRVSGGMVLANCIL